MQGSAHGLIDFWASPRRMREGFVEGYCLMAARIEPSRAEGSVREEASRLLETILEEHSEWKADLGFAKPALWMERDALPLVLALLLAVGAFVLLPVAIYLGH